MSRKQYHRQLFTPNYGVFCYLFISGGTDES